MTYVYPVISRRAGGLSVGVNLNINNACNWACIYCQVPNLTRGSPPPVDLPLLEVELRRLLHAVISGDYLARNAPEAYRKLVDIAFSGNGEPTSSREFEAAVTLVSAIVDEMGLRDQITLRVITNGSMLHRPPVRTGIAHIGAHGGEIWFKLDRATSAGMHEINQTLTTPQKVAKSICLCGSLAPTWIQTCLFAVDGKEIGAAEFEAYLQMLQQVQKNIRGVYLYGLARPSLQPAAKRLSALSTESLLSYAQRIETLGIQVIATP